MKQVDGLRVNEAMPGAPAPTQRFERKFFVSPRNIGLAYALLRQVCRPDSEYPEGQVNSLYFDTPDLDYYTRSASGEFEKAKVRIRWYNEIGDLQEMVPVFLEHKSRRGFTSRKQRRRFLVLAERLELARLGAGVVDRNMLVDTLARLGHYLENLLRPIILTSYRRHRLNEMLTGTRVSLDFDIRSSIVARELGHGEGQQWLRGGVIEVKGPTLELPTTLRRMSLLDVDWSRFSKYCYCLDAHLSDPGTVGRLWPSGRMAEP